MFQIQMGYPDIIQRADGTYQRIRDIFPGLFHSDEAFIVLWQDIPICFRYREDLECNFASILSMLQTLKENTEGSTLLILSNEILNLKIQMHWQAESLCLNLHVVTDYNAYQKYSAALNEHNELQLDKSGFMAEWHTLIHQLVVSFHAGKVCVADQLEQQKLLLLQNLDRQLAGYGCMYTEIINGQHSIH